MSEATQSVTGVRVLVTGAGGFIGSHLTRRLVAEGAHVRALDLSLDRLRDVEGIEACILADVANRDVQSRAVEGVDTVFHLAAAHLEVLAGEDTFRRVNVEGARTLAEACAEAGVRRLVHCSSVGVFGTVRNPPADETSECRPEIAYERTKLDGERAVLDAATRHGVEVVVIRPVWVYGPGCGRTEKLFRTIERGRFVVAGRGDGLRHCVYIEDMVDAFLLAARSSDAVGETLIVGDAEAVTVRELVDRIARQVGARPPIGVPRVVLSTAALVAETLFGALGKEPPLSRRTLKFFDANTAFRIDRARRLLGFDPRFDLERGLAATHERLRAGDEASSAGSGGRGSARTPTAV